MAFSCGSKASTTSRRSRATHPGTSISTLACSVCGWSRRPSTRTIRASTTCSTPTRTAAAAPTSRSSSTPARSRAARAPAWCTTIVSRVASSDSLDFWADRLGGEGVATERSGDSLRFADPEGMAHELVVVDRPDPPLIARHREIPAEHALQGFEARARLQHAARLDAAACSRRRSSSRPRATRLGGARRRARRPLRARPAARRTRRSRRRHRAPRRLRLDLRGSRGLGRARAGRRPQPDAGDRPLLLPLDLLPRAGRRALRDRDARPGLHRRRAAGVARRAPLAAAGVRAPARAHRAVADAAPRHPRLAAPRERRRGVRPPLRAGHAARPRCCCCTAPAATSIS